MDWSTCIDAANPELNVASINCVFVLYSKILDAAFLFAGAVAVVFIIIAGYKFIRSGGDPKQVEGARKTMTFSIIGLLLLLFSFAIINFVADFTGTSCIKVFGFDSCINEAGQEALDQCVAETAYSQEDKDASVSGEKGACTCKPDVGNLGPVADWSIAVTCEVSASTDADKKMDANDASPNDGKIQKTFYECDTNGNGKDDPDIARIPGCRVQ